MVIIHGREDESLSLHAAINRITREENIEESVQEAFELATRRFKTVDMLDFIVRTRGLSSWIEDAYQVADSERLGNYRISRKESMKARMGVAQFLKGPVTVRFNYVWRNGPEQEYNETMRGAKILLEAIGSRHGLDLNGDQLFREKFSPRDYSLASAHLRRRELVEVKPFGIFLLSYNRTNDKRVCDSRKEN